MAFTQYALRPATLADRPLLEALIDRSFRTLAAPDYTAQQIDLTLRNTIGVDTQLIADGTYYVAESAAGIVGCGGWSYRRTLFGGDVHDTRDAGRLDPATDAAKIRAFFVDPAAARQGVGTAILSHCEAQAMAQGFRRFELMATLPGVKLYAVRGYVAGTPVVHTLAPGLTIRFVPMAKTLPAAESPP